jgi:hypothetical protein
VTLLLSAGASLSVVHEEVIKPSIKLRQLNIKLFKWRIILLLKQKDILSSNINNNTTLYYKRIWKEFSCHDYINKSFFVANLDTINIFWLKLIKQLKMKLQQIVWQQFTAWTDWFVTSHGENIRPVASCCNYVIKLKLQIFILVEFATIFLYSLIKMTFNLKGSVHQQFSFTVKLIKSKL